MITIARFQAPEEAHLFSGYLEANEIPAHVFDEHTVQVAWYFSNAIGGVRVVVDEGNAEEAKHLSQDYFECLLAEPRIITVARAWPLVFLLSLIVGIPTLLFGRRTAQ